MSALEDLLAFHGERGSLAEFGLAKLAESVTKATAAMEATLAAEAAAQEARLEAQRVHPWPLSQSIASPDDLLVWSIDGRLPNLDQFESDGLRYAFTRPDGLLMFVIPARFRDTVPFREMFGWACCDARDVLRLSEIGGSQALHLIQSPALGLALFRRLSTSSHRNAVAAASAIRARLVTIGRDPLETALPVASFYREWLAQDRAADRIFAMCSAAAASGALEPLADDPDDVQRALADKQTRDSLEKMQQSELARQAQAEDDAAATTALLARLAADVASLKQHATHNATESTQ